MIIHVVGARPQFVKLAPLAAACRAEGLDFKVVHTGQHYDHSMSGLHFETLGISKPDYNLNIGSGSHGAMTGAMLAGLEEIFIKEQPRLVIVYGDTNSTLAAALAAAKLHIPVGHVEAGVRSYDRRMPEEINRVATDHIADYHFCPTMNAVNLLRKEGIQGIFSGDVMLDILNRIAADPVPHSLGEGFILTTIHRAENTDDEERFRAIWQGLNELAVDYDVVFPVHPRTRVRYGDMLEQRAQRLELIEPVSYLEMISLLKSAGCMLTDSGGVQKEACLLNTPCVTVRNVTEWPETIEAGANVLVEPAGMVAAVRQQLARPVNMAASPFGDGHAAEHIAQFIRENCI